MWKLSGSETEGMGTREEGTTASQLKRVDSACSAATLREVRPVLIVEVGTLDRRMWSGPTVPESGSGRRSLGATSLLPILQQYENWRENQAVDNFFAGGEDRGDGCTRERALNDVPCNYSTP